MLVIDSLLYCKTGGLRFDINHIIAWEFAIDIDLSSMILEGCVFVQMVSEFVLYEM
jgi:hypothetical protein